MVFHQTHSLSKHISVFTQVAPVDDPPLVLRLLEVRVRIQEKHFLELSLVEIVCEIFHGVGANAGDVLVLAWMQMSQHFDPVLYEVADFHSDLHSD